MVELTQEEYDQLLKDLADSQAASNALKAQLEAGKGQATPMLKIGQSWEFITKELDFSMFSTPAKEKLTEEKEETEVLTKS